MTQDFKDTLLKYLTGNLDEQTGSNTPQFQPLETVTNNLDTYIQNNTQGSGSWQWQWKTILQGKGGNNNDLDIYALVGNEDNSTITNGFIVLLDNEFNPIQYIDSFTSGVRIGEIFSIKVASDGSVYLLENSTESNKIRIVLLNNIFMKLPLVQQYKCKIRITYFLPNELQISFNSMELFRSYSGIYYGLVCNNQTNNKLVVETLKAEVGVANEWTNYTYDYSSLNIVMNYTSGECYFENDNFDFRALLYQTGNNNVYKFYLSSGSITYSLINISSYQYYEQSTDVQTIILQKEQYYLGICSFERQNNTFTGNRKNSIVKYNNGTLTLISEQLTTGTSVPLNRFIFYSRNGIAFYRLFYQNNTQYDGQIGVIYNDNISYITISNLGENSPGNYYINGIFIVTQTYNLYTYYCPYTDFEQFYKCQQIFNPYNYNGLEYENINSLKPNSSILYDDNNNIIFARNLYNLSVNGNTTVSTIEIPNTLLNGIDITNKELYSQTNMAMNLDSTVITKNIYEALNLNFFNTLVMKNDNTANEIINNPGAIRLNNSISQTTDYSDATANKIRINYQDGTSLVSNVGTPTITNGVATYTISIYVHKTITNIEIISNDENTSYQTITGTFGIGKYYTLTQDVRVE